MYCISSKSGKTINIWLKKGRQKVQIVSNFHKQIIKRINQIPDFTRIKKKPLTYFDKSSLTLLHNEGAPLHSLFSVDSFQNPILFFSVSSRQTYLLAKCALAKLLRAQRSLDTDGHKVQCFWNQPPDDILMTHWKCIFTWLPGSSCPGIVLSHDFLLTFSPQILLICSLE